MRGREGEEEVEVKDVVETESRGCLSWDDKGVSVITLNFKITRTLVVTLTEREIVSEEKI